MNSGFVTLLWNWWIKLLGAVAPGTRRKRFPTQEEVLYDKYYEDALVGGLTPEEADLAADAIGRQVRHSLVVLGGEEKTYGAIKRLYGGIMRDAGAAFRIIYVLESTGFRHPDFFVQAEFVRAMLSAVTPPETGPPDRLQYRVSWLTERLYALRRMLEELNREARGYYEEDPRRFLRPFEVSLRVPAIKLEVCGRLAYLCFKRSVPLDNVVEYIARMGPENAHVMLRLISEGWLNARTAEELDAVPKAVEDITPAELRAGICAWRKQEKEPTLALFLRRVRSSTPTPTP